MRPRWVANLRRVLKPAFAPVGRARWHAFERRYIDYWMHNTHSHVVERYATVARDRRGFRSAASWHAERYLASKGVALDDLLASAGP